MSVRRPARDDRLFSNPPAETGKGRICPWCGSDDTVLVQRGYTGPTDETNQYFHCRKCSKVTYEIVSKTAREMRLGRFRSGGIYKDFAHTTKYQVSRVLKVGINEYLLYLKPIKEDEEATRSAPNPG